MKCKALIEGEECGGAKFWVNYSSSLLYTYNASEGRVEFEDHGPLEGRVDETWCVDCLAMYEVSGKESKKILALIGLDLG